MAAKSNCARRVALALGAALLVAFPALHAAATDISAPGTLTVEVNQAKRIALPSPAATVFVGNPEIADVQVPNDTTVLLYGKKAGATTLYAIGRDDKVTRFAVTIDRQVTEIAAALSRDVPDAHVEVQSAPGGLVVTGTAQTAADAQRLKELAHEYLGDKEQLVFDVAVTEAMQVNLQVRVAQVSRTIDNEFGFNWNALFNNSRIAVGLLTGRAPTTSFGNFIASPSNYDSLGFGYQSAGGSVNVSAILDALQDEGLVQVLAEPNLTAMSGETANFLAGGEFPVPVPQGLQQITIEWKHYGVSVDFTPTVLDGNRMSIKVQPEVSELSTVGAVTIDGIQVPALTERRAETTVELASGQSFAIAGLFQNNVTSDLQRFPWLGDIPVLGALFRSSSFQRQESELVIIVTPYLVKPAQHPGDLKLPSDGIVYSNDLERVLLGRTVDEMDPSVPHLSGAAGFLWE